MNRLQKRDVVIHVRRWFRLIAALPLLLSAGPHPAWGEEGHPQIEVRKVPGTTSVMARLAGEIDAPPAAVQAVLCDLEGHTKFSDITERVAIVTLSQTEGFKASPPQGRRDVEPQVVPGKHRASCPGRTYVLTLMDFPFPLGDGWSLAAYDAAVTDGTFRMTFDTVVGSDKGAGEFTVTALGESRSQLVMEYRIDLGIPLPGFLLRHAVKTQLPGQFAAIAREAKALAGQQPMRR